MRRDRRRGKETEPKARGGRNMGGAEEKEEEDDDDKNTFTTTSNPLRIRGNIMKRPCA